MAFKKWILKYFSLWWIPVLGYGLAFLIFLLGIFFQSDFIIDVFLTLFLINVVGTIISSIVQIVNRKWYWSILQLFLSFILFKFFYIIFLYSPPDFFAVLKKIPENIEISEPLVNEPTKEEYIEHDLFLAKYGQPGIYKYHTDYKPNEKGSFFIKAYEITSGVQLSRKRMKTKSMVEVKSLLPDVENLYPNTHSGELTIYEGDWGQKYAARIELWFIPINGKDEYKVCERNFIVEGWMR